MPTLSALDFQILTIPYVSSILYYVLHIIYSVADLWLPTPDVKRKILSVPGFFVSIMIIFLSYHFTLLYFGRTEAIITILFVSTDVYLMYSSITFGYYSNLSYIFILISLIYIKKYYYSGRRKYIPLSSLFLSLAILNCLLSGVFLLCCVGTLLMKYRKEIEEKKKEIGKFHIFILWLSLALLPHLIYVQTSPPEFFKDDPGIFQSLSWNPLWKFMKAFGFHLILPLGKPYYVIWILRGFLLIIMFVASLSAWKKYSFFLLSVIIYAFFLSFSSGLAELFSHPSTIFLYPLCSYHIANSKIKNYLLPFSILFLLLSNIYIYRFLDNSKRIPEFSVNEQSRVVAFLLENRIYHVSDIWGKTSLDFLSGGKIKIISYKSAISRVKNDEEEKDILRAITETSRKKKELFFVLKHTEKKRFEKVNIPFNIIFETENFVIVVLK